jgi:rod shape-determining protein MreD
MVDPVRREVWILRGIYVLIAAVLFLVRILPLGGVAGTWPGPDLFLCLTLGWVLRRPDHLPVLLIALVMLAEDFLLMRPPGLWTALVVVATEFLRSRAALTRELGFAMEWLLVAAVMLGLLLAYRLFHGIAFLPQPVFGMAMLQTFASILCYPVVVGLAHVALSLRKPAAGEVDAMGRPL